MRGSYSTPRLRGTGPATPLAQKNITREETHGAVLELQDQIRGDLIEYYAGAGRRTAVECREDADAAAYTSRPGEARAFGDGRPEYQALAAGITGRFANASGK